jgi:hypothetical protein
METHSDIGPLVELVAGDRRLTIRLMGFWQATRAAAERCARSDHFLDIVPDELLSDCCMAVMAADGMWDLRDIGNDIARQSGLDSTSIRRADMVPGSLLAEATHNLDDAFNLAVPVLHEGETRDGNGSRSLFRAILLPLADDHGRIMQILAGARCATVLSDA